LNESYILTGEAQESSDMGTVFRVNTIHYRIGLMFLGDNVSLVNGKAFIVNYLTCPGAF
jgi:hypothetical protein